MRRWDADRLVLWTMLEAAMQSHVVVWRKMWSAVEAVLACHEQGAARRPGARTESLERRMLLTAVSWDGGGDGTNWSDPVNWSGDVLPGSAADVTIGASVSAVVFNTDATIHSLVSNRP